MTFDEFRTLIAKSDPADWRSVPEQGPTYRVALAASTGPQPGIDLDVNEHHTIAVYTPDIDVTVAFGLPYDFEHSDGGGRRERTFDWSNAFPDSEVDLRVADFFYRGSLVDRVVYVLVDGARAALPWAREYDGLKVDPHDFAVARLVHSVSDASENFDEYFRRAGFILA